MQPVRNVTHDVVSQIASQLFFKRIFKLPRCRGGSRESFWQWIFNTFLKSLTLFQKFDQKYNLYELVIFLSCVDAYIFGCWITCLCDVQTFWSNNCDTLSKTVPKVRNHNFTKQSKWVHARLWCFELCSNPSLHEYALEPFWLRENCK